MLYIQICHKIDFSNQPVLNANTLITGQVKIKNSLLKKSSLRSIVSGVRLILNTKKLKNKNSPIGEFLFSLRAMEGTVNTLSVTSIFLLKNLSTPTRLVSLRLSIPPSKINKIASCLFSLRAMEESNPHQRFWRPLFYH